LAVIAEQRGTWQRMHGHRIESVTSDKLMLERKLKEEGFLLKQIEKEKIDLENKLEAEQEYITNQLHKKIQAASVDKMKLEKKLEHEQALLTDCITQVLDRLKADSSESAETAEASTIDKKLLEQLVTEVQNLRMQEKGWETKREKAEVMNTQLRNELRKLQNENFFMSRRIQREADRVQLHAETEGQLKLNVAEWKSFAKHSAHANRTRSMNSSPAPAPASPGGRGAPGRFHHDGMRHVERHGRSPFSSRFGGPPVRTPTASMSPRRECFSPLVPGTPTDHRTELYFERMQPRSANHPRSMSLPSDEQALASIVVSNSRVRQTLEAEASQSQQHTPRLDFSPQLNGET